MKNEFNARRAKVSIWTPYVIGMLFWLALILWS